MILEQYYLGCLAQASYLIADEKTKTAAIVDPRRDTEVYDEEAKRLGVKIEHVILTHFHADFVSGHLELSKRTGAKIHLGAQAQAEYEFQPKRDGDVLELGRVRLEFLETPGHTPESMSVVVYDPERSEKKPYAVFTGDALFVGDVGRPDLMASIGLTSEELAERLYDSLHDKLLKLPDTTLVYPAHGAGSMCGKNISNERFTTIGEQRKYNPSLQLGSREEFVAAITKDQPAAPAYFSYDAMLNRTERDTLDDVLQRVLRPLKVEDVLRYQNSGAQILDTRHPDDYAEAHWIGSTNIGLNGQYATWAGTILDRQSPIVLIAEAGKEGESAMRLGRIGYDNIAGFLSDGIESLESRPDLLRHVSRISAQALGERLSGNEPPQILDVRTAGEWEQKHIVGSVHIPLNELKNRIDEVPRNSNFVVHCAAGYRSSIAASLLEQNGFSNFSDLKGGYLAWELTEAES